MVDPGELRSRLENWTAAHVSPGAQVADLRPMPGHSGLSFGFDVVEAGGVRRGLVIRLAPPGVRRSGNTDVLRQVPLLGALHASGIPIAPLVWSTGDPSWFGTDAIVQERLDAGPLSSVDRSAVASGLSRAVEVLAAVHALDWRRLLPEWAAPRPVADEVAFWGALLSKHQDAEWAEAGRRLGEALLRSDPGGHRIGLVHGDFQPSNILVDRHGALAAVIDWEIAGIGPTGLDLGWLAMMTDPSSWHPGARASFPVVSDRRELGEQYAAAAGCAVSHLDWYQALACYRFGAIAGFNVRLHRTGRRPDPLYDVLASSVPVLFARGEQLLADGGS